MAMPLQLSDYAESLTCILSMGKCTICKLCLNKTTKVQHNSGLKFCVCQCRKGLSSVVTFYDLKLSMSMGFVSSFTVFFFFINFFHIFVSAVFL